MSVHLPQGLKKVPCDLIRYCFGVLVLPVAENSPSVVLEYVSNSLVALAVSSELCSPPVGVCFRNRAVDGALVPVASVDEDCDSAPLPTYIGAETLAL